MKFLLVFFADVFREINETDGASHPYQHGVVETALPLQLEECSCFKISFMRQHTLVAFVWNVIVKFCRFIVKLVHIIPMGNGL